MKSWNSHPPGKLAEARPLINQGLPRAEISRRLGVSTEWLLRNFGPSRPAFVPLSEAVKAEMQAMRARNVPYSWIARRFKVSDWVVIKWCYGVHCNRRNRQPVTTFEVARMRKLRLEGKTLAETARLLKRSAQTVSRYTQDIPLPPQSKLPPVPAIEAMLAQGRSKHSIAREFGVTSNAIRKLLWRSKRKEAA